MLKRIRLLSTVFLPKSEKEMFEILITVNGVGPKIALSILSGITVEELKNAILTEDVSRITAVPGIGRKTSERLVLELKNKVENIHEEGLTEIPLSIRNEASAALTTLGYNSKLADKTVREILNNEPQITLEELIKKALSSLNS